jgi:hypothetical protein
VPGVTKVPKIRWVMRGLLLFVLAFANLNEIWSPDVLPNALLPFTLVREGNVNYDEFVFRPNVTELHQNAGLDRIDSEAYFFRACGVSTATEPPKAPRSRGGPPAPGPNDHVCSVFPPGMGLLALPFFLPFILSGAQALDLALLLRVGHLAAAFYETIAALLLWAVFRRFASERWALGLVLLYFLGTSVRTVSSQALWQHAGVHLALAIALWLVMLDRALPWPRDFLAGLALGLGGVIRQTTAVIGAFVNGWKWRAALVGLAGVALGLLPLAAFNWIAFGSPVEQGYGDKPFGRAWATGLAGLLISPSRGLFVYEPYAVFALASLFLARRYVKAEQVAARLSSLTLGWLFILGLYVSYEEWWGGRVFGPRFLDDLAPMLFVALAWGIGHGILARTWARVLFLISAAWSLLIFNAAALVYDQTWDTVPVNVNDDPSKLFSWGDPQWLAVLQAVPSGGARLIVALGLTALALLFLLRVEGLLARRVIASAR